MKNPACKVRVGDGDYDIADFLGGVLDNGALRAAVRLHGSDRVDLVDPARVTFEGAEEAADRRAEQRDAAQEAIETLRQLAAEWHVEIDVMSIDVPTARIEVTISHSQRGTFRCHAAKLETAILLASAGEVRRIR